MSDKKQKKSLLIFLGILFGLVFLIISGIVIWQKTRYIINAELSDFEWPHGQMLIIFSDNYNNYEKSIDGKINAKFDKNLEVLNGLEILSLTKHLRFGKLEGGEKGLYYITPEKVQLVSNREREMTNLSLSPEGDYLRYRSNSRLCVTSFFEIELGECVDLLEELPGEWDWKNEYWAEGDWYKEGGEYLVIIRSRQEHYLEDAGENRPQRRVQKEVAKFIYNPNNQSIRQIDLESDYILKTSMSLETEEEKVLHQYFGLGGLYEFVHDQMNGRVLIKENSTGLLAEFAKGEYFGKMPGFNISWNN